MWLLNVKYNEGYKKVDIYFVPGYNDIKNWLKIVKGEKI